MGGRPGAAVIAAGSVVLAPAITECGWQLDTYAIDEAHDPKYASGFGDLSIHEVAASQVRPDLAYFSYYAGGFRVAKVKHNKLVEVGRFIDEDGSNFWGVDTFNHFGREYVAASDRDYGLYIFQYTGR